MDPKYYLIVYEPTTGEKSYKVETDEELIRSLQGIYKRTLQKAVVDVVFAKTNAGWERLNFDEALAFANTDILKREKSIQGFPGSELQIGQNIGITWEPHNRDFFIYDIRQIMEALSGRTFYEYKLARQHLVKDELCYTSWLVREKLYVLEPVVA